MRFNIISFKAKLYRFTNIFIIIYIVNNKITVIFLNRYFYAHNINPDASIYKLTPHKGFVIFSNKFFKCRYFHTVFFIIGYITC